MPRWTKALAAAGACLTLLTGCSGTGSGDLLNADGKGPVKGGIDYVWWGAGTRNARTQAVIDLFHRAHPQASVQGQSMDFGTYWNKLNVQAAGHSMPCVPQMQARQLGDYTRRHTLVPLDTMVRQGIIDVSGIPESVLDTGRGQDGRLYMIPYGAAFDGIMYNADLARKAHLPAPPEKFDWTWYARWLREAHARLPKGVAATSLDAVTPDVFISYAQSHGQPLFRGTELGFDKALLASYWRMWEGLRRDGVTLTATAQSEQPGPIEQSRLAQGKVLAGSMPGNAVEAAQSTLDGVHGGHVTVTTHPWGPKGPGNVLITSGLSISATCENVPTAAAFIDFFTNDAAAAHAYASDNGAVTVTRLLRRQLHDPELPAQKKQWLGVYQDIVENQGEPIRYPAGYHYFEEAFARYYQDIGFGRRSVDQAVDDFFSEVEGELQQ